MFKSIVKATYNLPHRPGSTFHGSAVCVCVGVSLHYSWLVYYCCSVCCCFHVYRVFTAAGLQAFDSRVVVKYAVFSLLTSAVVIATVVVTSMVATDGDKVGYGDVTCHLDSAFLIGEFNKSPIL